VWVYATGDSQLDAGGGPPGGASGFHWDSRHWANVPWDYSTFDGNPDEIDSVTVASGELWLLGLAYVGEEDDQFLAYGNGSGWTTLPLPPGENYIRNSVDAPIDYMDPISPKNVWAYVTDQDTEQNYVYHWNGSDWSKIHSPPWWAFDLHAVPDAQDAWGRSRSGIWHWHDGHISLVQKGAFSGVRAFTASNVWAWGNGIEAHYDGSAWSVYRIPAPPRSATGGYAVAAGGDLSGAVVVRKKGRAYPGLEQYERCAG
jgi:hypothetical protein